ncbi:MAG: HupE/UreJ family protein, partial [Chryseobacterium sp.]
MQDFLFYLKLGWEHIISLDALDHQLFVLALIAVYSFKEWKKILILVTAFTIGHSITLALSILDIVRLPSNWIEFLIPLTIVLTALGNILMKNKKQKQDKTHYYLALFFGLIHGLGFANTARVMIAKSQSIAVPLLGFNIGLELGQIAIVCMILIFLFIYGVINDFSLFIKL